jgi:hypothetical protein
MIMSPGTIDDSGAAAPAAPPALGVASLTPAPTAEWDSFGVGCFHFSHKTPSGTASLNIAPGEYYAKLKAALSSVANITEIEIVPADHFEDYIADDWSPAEHPDIAAGYGIYPWPTSGYVQFKIFLPRRVQERIIGEFRIPSDTEVFLVKIIYGHGLPITFVRSVAGYTPDPSAMVTIIWRYLRECMGSEEKEIRFDLIGPSPCHTDFYIRTHADGKYDVEYTENTGYDTVNISAPASSNADEIWSNVEYRIRHEYKEFYAVVKERNSINRKLISILHEADEVIEGKLSGRFWKNFLRSNQFRKKVLSLTLRSERAELEITSLIQQLQETIERIERDWSFSLVKPKLTREARELERIPLPSYKRMLSTLDGNSSVSATNQTALVAAVVGALVSVAMTLFIQFLVTPSVEDPTLPTTGSATSDVDTENIDTGLPNVQVGAR